jgi:hypothetical protein
LAKCEQLENIAENAKCTGKEKTFEKKRNKIFKLLTFFLVTQQADELGKM